MIHVCNIWGLFHKCYMCSSSISYMFTAACCGCIGSSKSWYLLCRSIIAELFRQDQRRYPSCHYMVNSQRFAMTEIMVKCKWAIIVCNKGSERYCCHRLKITSLSNFNHTMRYRPIAWNKKFWPWIFRNVVFSALPLLLSTWVLVPKVYDQYKHQSNQKHLERSNFLVALIKNAFVFVSVHKQLN